MSESTLSLSYNEFRQAVGEFLNYGGDYSVWSTARAAQIDRVVQSGYRTFLYPPAVEGIEAGYEWSFLKPVTTIDTVADDADQDLPDDFGRIIDGFTFAANSQVPAVLVDVGEAKIRGLRQNTSETGRPRVAAVRIKASDGTDGQRREIMWFPTPDAAYTLSYRYESFAGKLTTASPYPLGAMKHAELIKESCLAAAEILGNEEKGIHWDQFMRMLISSINRDKKEGAIFFGNVGCHGEYENTSESRASTNYTLTVYGNVIQ